jgi:hypothetical protein
MRHAVILVIALVLVLGAFGCKSGSSEDSLYSSSSYSSTSASSSGGGFSGPVSNPEPSTLALFGLSLLALMGLRKFRK